MSLEFLENLPLTAEEKERISVLGATDGAALLAMIQAAPEEFEGYFGRQRTRKLTTMLKGTVVAPERTVLDTPPRQFPASGAILDRRPPVLRPPAYDLQTRDRLFEQLQKLRQAGDSSLETQQRIAELEESLNALLEKA